MIAVFEVQLKVQPSKISVLMITLPISSKNLE